MVLVSTMVMHCAPFLSVLRLIKLCSRVVKYSHTLNYTFCVINYYQLLDLDLLYVFLQTAW